MRVLVTGGRGQLGRALQQALSGHDFQALSHQELDVTDPEALARAFGEFRPQAVIHAAAWTDTAGCEADPERALRINGGGTGTVAAACRDAAAVMLYVSTNEVFDGGKGEPYTEEDEPNPLNSYARSKLAGEQRLRSLLADHYIVRTAWLYGAGRVSFPEKILQAAEASDVLKGVTDEIASPTWVADLAPAMVKLLETGRFGVYHLTNSGYCSRLEWAREVLRLTGRSRVRLEPVSQSDFGAPCRKPVFSALSLEKARRGGIQMADWRQALARYLGQGS